MHHFRIQRDHLAILIRNIMQVWGAGQSYQQLTDPAELRRHAIELLNIRAAAYSKTWANICRRNQPIVNSSDYFFPASGERGNPNSLRLRARLQNR